MLTTKELGIASNCIDCLRYGAEQVGGSEKGLKRVNVLKEETLKCSMKELYNC